MLQIYITWMHLFDEKRNIKFWIKSKRPSIIWWKIESTFQLVLLLSSCSTHVLVLISSQYYSLSVIRIYIHNPSPIWLAMHFAFLLFHYAWVHAMDGVTHCEKKRKKI